MAFHEGRCLLKLRLKERHMSQVELARKTGYSPQIISHYANNRSLMSLSVARTIAHFLKCDMEDLYEWRWSDD